MVALGLQNPGATVLFTALSCEVAVSILLF